MDVIPRLIPCFSFFLFHFEHNLLLDPDLHQIQVISFYRSKYIVHFHCKKPLKLSVINCNFINLLITTDQFTRHEDCKHF